MEPEGQSTAPLPVAQEGGRGYELPAARLKAEDILFCIDVGPETMVEMKLTGPNGRPYNRLDTIKQAILLFVHSKLAINTDHRFAFATLSKSARWLRKEFSNEAESVNAVLQGLSVDSYSSTADFTQLFKVANHEARKSHEQNRILRVILVFCRSTKKPEYQLPSIRKLFTMDVMYIHDKPGPGNCPQEVYDMLVECTEQVSEYEGYVVESGQGLARSHFRNMCLLLCHPQQRCAQDFLGLPVSLTKKPRVGVSAHGGDAAVSS